MAKRVTTIPATLNRFNSTPITEVRKRKVAGYARVSTDSEEQATSYDAQVDYYTNYIKNNSEWEFVGIYTDDGITATNTKRREGFKEMVDDALAGKIDLIITKSCSRFARNTVDSLVTVRKLKEKGVEIYFEKENIWTLDAKGELLITIMSSLAQEESRSISENTTWGKRKQFADGKASVGFKNFLGYDRGENGEFVINEEQARVVRLIYKLYLEGLSHYKIATQLTELGIKTPAGKDKWCCSSVMSILKNEKYKGDALLQKEYTTDFLTKKRKKNEGEIPQYYVEGHHEGIVSAELFEQVQAEISRRKEMGNYSGVSIFSSRIKCGECGGWFGQKVWHSNDKYRRVIYRCNRKYKGCKCQTPHLTEDEVKDIFIKAFNIYFSDKDELLENIDLIINVLCNTDELESRAGAILDELNIIIGMTNDLITTNARVAQNQDDYQVKYDNLVGQYEAKKAEYDIIQEQIELKSAKAELLRKHKACLESVEGTITEFDSSLWSGTVDFITVTDKDKAIVTFKDGVEIEA